MNQEELDEQAFYEELVALCLRFVCFIERKRLNRPHTTAELRKLGKEKLSELTDECSK